MKKLLLMRHAKSDWSSPVGSDHQRPLSARGDTAAPMMGQFIVGQDVCPTKILCSDAARTRQTLNHILPSLSSRVDVDYSPALYHASANMLLNVAASLGDEHDCAMLLGHNPGIHEFACNLLSQKEDASSAELTSGHFPTAALAAIVMDVDLWADIALGIGKLDFYQTPKALKHKLENMTIEEEST